MLVFTNFSSKCRGPTHEELMRQMNRNIIRTVSVYTKPPQSENNQLFLQMSQAFKEMTGSPKEKA